MVLVLVGVAVVIGAVLAWVNNITEKPIAEKAQQTLAAGIKEVMNSTDIKVEDPDTVKMEIQGKESIFTIHNVYTTDGAYLGSAVESTTMGFGGDLKVLVGFNAEGTILGYTILQASETPGLGAKADKWFQKDGKGNIIGKSVAKGDLKVSKDGGDVDVLKAVNQAYSAYQDNHAANAKGADGASGASVQHN